VPLKKKKDQGREIIVQAAEHLLSKWESMGLNPSTTKNK
jgi:hypothetical protein